MDIEAQAADLRKEIEKINRILTDGTALTQQQWATKQARQAVLLAQLAGLQSQLQSIHHLNWLWFLPQ